ILGRQTRCANECVQLVYSPVGFDSSRIFGHSLSAGEAGFPLVAPLRVDAVQRYPRLIEGVHVLLWLPREFPLDSGDEVQTRRRIPIDLLIMPIQSVSQIAVNRDAISNIVIEVHAQIGKSGI